MLYLAEAASKTYESELLQGTGANSEDKRERHEQDYVNFIISCIRNITGEQI